METLEWYKEIAESKCTTAIEACLSTFEKTAKFTPLTDEDRYIIAMLKEGLIP